MQAQTLSFSFEKTIWEQQQQHLHCLLGISQPALADVSVPFPRTLLPKRGKLHMDQVPFDENLIWNAEKSWKSVDKLQAYQFRNIMNSKNSVRITIAEWASELMEAFPKVMLSVPRKTLIYWVHQTVPGAGICFQPWIHLFRLDMDRWLSSRSARVSSCCPFSSSPAFCSPSTLHCTPACEFVHHNSSQNLWVLL